MSRQPVPSDIKKPSGRRRLPPQTGTVFRLRGKGIPVLNSRGRGDQYVTVTIETPRDLNREQKEALKRFSETLGEGNYEKHHSFFGKKK